MSAQIATVLGASGFIGRYVVRRLAATGAVVRVGVRASEAAMFLRPMGGVGQIVPLYAPIGDEAAVARAVAGASVVVNLVGILNERRRGDFEHVHAEGAARVARLARGAARLVHVSSLSAGADAPSRYGQSKAAGEAAVLAERADAVVLRPSVVFGAEDRFFNRFATMASVLPVLPVVHGATRLQPVFVGDVADAAMTAPSGVWELGGPDVRTLEDLVRWTLALIGRSRPVLDLPIPLAMMQACVLERLPGKLLTTDQIRTLSRDNVVDPARRWGAAVTPMDLVVPGYLARFRKGGGRKMPNRT